MSNLDPAELLDMHASTRGLDKQQIGRIAASAEVVRVDEGQVVQAPGEEIDALMLVISGSLSMALVLPSGEERTILFFGRDDQIGLLSIVQDETIPTRVVANHQSLLVRIPRESAAELLHEIPLWSRNLLRGLAPKLRDTLLGEKHPKRPRLVVLIHASEKSRHLTSLLTEQLMFLGESVGLMSDHDAALATQPTRSTPLLDSNGTLLSIEEFHDIIAAWSGLDRVVVDIQLSIAETQLNALIAGCDATYWLCATNANESLIAHLEPLVRSSPGLREKISVVRVLDAHEQVAPRCPGLTDICSADFKLHWDGCRLVDSRACTKAGLDRLIHHLRGVTLGLALGGGAARGMAHLGVLQVLENAGITIDRMSGTSAGALTGIMFAAGHSADFCIESFARDLKPGWPYRMVPYGDAFYVFFKYRFDGWDGMLRKYLNDWRLEQLAIPFSSVAVDLVAAEPVVRRQGDAIHALLESINLPGIARPICRDGKALVDGGVLDVVPADVLANQGASIVVSSDVSARIAFEFEGNTLDTPPDQMHRCSGRAALIRTRTVQDRNIRAIGGGAADIVIEPDVSSVELTDFKNAEKIAKLGYDAAEEALPELRRVLNAMDPQLFPL